MGARRIDGVDLSHYQKSINIDYDRAKAAGVKFIIHKATEGATWTDDTYRRRRREAAEHGLAFGAYHFARPEGSDAKAEANHFIDVARPRVGDMLPVLDLESGALDGKLSPGELADWVKWFVYTVYRRIGYTGMILYTDVDLPRIPQGLHLWVARYNNENEPPDIPRPFQTWSIWQFSNGQFGDPKHVPGIGNVDINTFRAWFPWGRIQHLRISEDAPRWGSEVFNNNDSEEEPDVGKRLNPKAYFVGARGSHVTWLDKRLVAHGYTDHHDGNGYQPGPVYTVHTRRNVADFQRAQGWTGDGANGLPGPLTLNRLAGAPPERPTGGISAVRRAAIREFRGTFGRVGMCLKRVRQAYDIGARYPSAISAWNNTPNRHKHRTSNARSIPRGYPVFWAGGRFGHVAISLGDGYCLSTDILRRGYVDRVKIDFISNRWGYRLVGWTDQLNGVNIK